MEIIKNQTDANQISNAAIRELVQQRINDLGEDFDADELGYFIVIEASDTIEAINQQIGFDILCNRFTGIRFDATGFTPSFEFIEEFPDCYDMVFVIHDSGFAVELLISNELGIDADLLAMCQRFAFKSETEDAP